MPRRLLSEYLRLKETATCSPVAAVELVRAVLSGCRQRVGRLVAVEFEVDGPVPETVALDGAALWRGVEASVERSTEGMDSGTLTAVVGYSEGELLVEVVAERDDLT